MCTVDGLRRWPLVLKLHLQPLSLPRRLGGGLESSNLAMKWMVPQATGPHPQSLSESPVICTAKHTLTAVAAWEVGSV